MSVETTAPVAHRRLEMVKGDLVCLSRGIALMPPRAQKILSEVAALHGVSEAAIFAPRMLKPIVNARQHFMTRCTRECGYSSTRIAQWLGKDHSTVLHGLKAFAAREKSGEIVAPTKRVRPGKTPEQKREARLRSLQRSHETQSQRAAERRARAYALTAQGLTVPQIAQRMGVTRETVYRWQWMARKAVAI